MKKSVLRSILPSSPILSTSSLSHGAENLGEATPPSKWRPPLVWRQKIAIWRETAENGRYTLFSMGNNVESQN